MIISLDTYVSICYNTPNSAGPAWDCRRTMVSLTLLAGGGAVFRAACVAVL